MFKSWHGIMVPVRIQKGWDSTATTTDNIYIYIYSIFTVTMKSQRLRQCHVNCQICQICQNDVFASIQFYSIQ